MNKQPQPRPDHIPAPPEGFDYWGRGPLPHQANKTGGPDIEAIPNDLIHGWESGFEGGSYSLHYAIRRGTELHRLNFGVSEPEKPAEPLLSFAEYSEATARETRKLIVERDELREWKRQQMEVTSQCDMQEVGRLLGMTLGDDIHENLIPAIKELLEARHELQTKLSEYKQALESADQSNALLAQELEELREWKQYLTNKVLKAIQ